MVEFLREEFETGLDFVEQWPECRHHLKARARKVTFGGGNGEKVKCFMECCLGPYDPDMPCEYSVELLGKNKTAHEEEEKRKTDKKYKKRKIV